MTKRTENPKGPRKFLLRATALGVGAVVAGCSSSGDLVGSRDTDGGPVGLGVNDGGGPVGVSVVDGGGPVGVSVVDGGGPVGLGVVDAGLEVNDGGPVGLGVVDAGAGGD